MTYFRGSDPSDFEPTNPRRAPSPPLAERQAQSAAWAAWVDERVQESVRAHIGVLGSEVGSQVRRFVAESVAKSIAPLQERCDRLEAENAVLRGRLSAVEAQEPDLSPLQAEAAAAVARAIAPLDAAMAAMPRSFLLDGGGDLVCVRHDGSTETLGHVQGKDGTTPPGIDDVDVDNDGNLIVSMTDGRLIARGRVRGEPGHDGRNGVDGEPGLGFDDLVMEQSGERTLTIRMTRGERTIEKTIHLAYPIYRGVWKPEIAEGEGYVIGDFVTFAGGCWSCKQPTTAKPGDGGDGWVLAVKPGRNAASLLDIARKVGAFKGTSEKEFIESMRGPEGRQGPPGVPGRDRT